MVYGEFMYQAITRTYIYIYIKHIYLVLHVKCLIFLSDFLKEIWVHREIFRKTSIFKCYWNPLGGRGADTWRSEKRTRGSWQALLTKT